MATLQENESYNDAVFRLNEDQRSKLGEFITVLKLKYPAVVTIEGYNITIDLNNYIKTNKDKVYDTELSDIKKSIEDFCKTNPTFKNKYEILPTPAQVVEVTDGRRRKTKRSPSKKSIKSKRKY